MANTVKVGAKEARVIFQEVEEGVGEPALLLESWCDCIQIQQGTECININYETVPELIKQLRALKPAK